MLSFVVGMTYSMTKLPGGTGEITLLWHKNPKIETNTERYPFIRRYKKQYMHARFSTSKSQLIQPAAARPAVPF